MRVVLLAFMLFLCAGSVACATDKQEAEIFSKCITSTEYMVRFVNITSTLMHVSSNDHSTATQWHIGSLMNILTLSTAFGDHLNKLKAKDPSILEIIAASQKEEQEKLNLLFLQMSEPTSAKKIIEDIMTKIKLCQAFLTNSEKI